MQTLILLTKTPAAGRVKTRLTPTLAPSEAAQAAGAFLRDLTSTLASFVNSDYWVAIPDGESAAGIRDWIGETARVVGQGPGSLGDRLTRLTDEAFAVNSGPALVIGSDHPSLPAGLIQGCLDAAREGNVGWIPTEDGGFAALAAPGPCAELFEDIPWSTPAVAEAVRSRAARSGRKLVEAGSWYDVDTAEDLARLQSDLERLGTCPHSARFLRELDPPLEVRRLKRGDER